MFNPFDMMHNWFIWAGIIFLLFVPLLTWIKTYNYFCRQSVTIDRFTADLKTTLKQRNVTLSNLGQSIGKYTSHEKKTFIGTAKARRTKNRGGLINALHEAHPDLKANQLYTNVMGDANISNLEGKVSVRIGALNAIIEDYNKKVVTLPTCFVAKAHHFEVKDLFSFDYEKTDYRANLFRR